jgi:hypothetical protein
MFFLRDGEFDAKDATERIRGDAKSFGFTFGFTFGRGRENEMPKH